MLSSRLFMSVKALILVTSLGFVGATFAQETNPMRNEMEGKRDLFAKHFLNDDGSMQAVISAGPVHYAKNGKFLDINTVIKSGTTTDYPFANTENLMETHFGATASKGIVNVLNNVTFKEFTNSKMYWEVNGTAQNVTIAQNAAVSIAENAATYHNLFPSIAAEFKIENGKRKLNYIIPSANALTNAPAGASHLVFTEDITLPSQWSYVMSADGLYILNNKNEAVLLYNSPYSVDSADKMPYQQNTSMEVSQHGNTITILTKVATNWLLNSSRSFPVMIDPTVTVSPANVANTTATINFTGARVDDIVAFGRLDDLNGQPNFMRGLVKFNTASVPDDAIVAPGIDIKFYIEDGSPNFSPANGHRLAIAHIPASMNTDLNNQTNNLLIFNTIQQTGYSPMITQALNTLGWKTHTITSAAMADEIMAQLAQDKFAVGFMPDGSFSPEVYLVASGHSSTNRPTLTFNYTQPDMSTTGSTKLIGLYPNPTQNELNIATDATVKSIEIFSLLGQSLQKNTNSNQISVTGLTNGIYAVQVTLDNGTVVNQKIIKN